MNLLDGVKGILTNTVVDKAADIFGIENGMMKSALKMFLPAIIGGVINRGSTKSGAGDLIDLFKNSGFGKEGNEDLIGVLGDEEKRGRMLDTGLDLLGNIFGNNKSGILDMLLKATGIGKSGGSLILSFLAPIVINKLASMVFKDKMSPADLSSFLNDQKDDIMSMVPSVGSLLGGGSETLGAASSGKTATQASKNPSTDLEDEEGGGMGFLKWLPLLLLGALVIWYFTNRSNDKSTEEVKTEVISAPENAKDAMRTKEVKAPEGNPASGSTNSYFLNDNGDLMNASGSIAYASGSYSLDNIGNLIDKNGRIIMPTASLTSDFMAKLKAVISGITSGNTPTLDQMRAMFGDMIVKKAGAKTSYALSQIQFNKENHKIENFSKAEVMGLAEALKANAKGKIEVHVHTADGKDEKDGMKLSETRAKVITDMLTTLGVNADQLKAVGVGGKDASKAGADKVDIVIK